MDALEMRKKFETWLYENDATELTADEKLIVDMAFGWLDMQRATPKDNLSVQIWPPTGERVVFEDDESTMEFNDDGIVITQKGGRVGRSFKMPEGVVFTGFVDVGVKIDESIQLPPGTYQIGDALGVVEGGYFKPNKKAGA